MDKLLKVTYVVFPLCLGFIIGGFAFGNTTIGVVGVILLVIDVIVGIIVRYLYENPNQPNKKPNIAPEKVANNLELFDEIFEALKEPDITKFLIARNFLATVCQKMSHAPSESQLSKVVTASSIYIDDFKTIAYLLWIENISIAELVSIYLVKANNKVRLFTVETSFPYALCEYANGQHINYGQLEKLDDDTDRIAEILKE